MMALRVHLVKQINKLYFFNNLKKKFILLTKFSFKRVLPSVPAHFF